MEEQGLTLKIKNLSAVALLVLQACATQAPQDPLPEAPTAPEPVPAVISEAPTPPPAAKPQPAPPPAAQQAPPAAVAPAPAPAPKPAPQAAAAKPAPPPARLDASQLPAFDGERMVLKAPRGLAKIDRTVPADDLWQRIRYGFAMPDLKGPLVRKKTAQYAADPEYLQRIFDRSRLYLYHIVEEIEKRGLPTELALLPMVESAFNPMAYSRAHASGLWQFIPGTGRRFDLEQNWWYDARRDVVDSTNAALDYLTKLYEMHGDWHLALASYNWGENAVRRAMARNRAARKPTDYSSLRMPRETRNYIPKLQALKNIIADPTPFGVDLDPIPNEAYFALVTETPDIDVQLAAKLAEMPVGEFIALNPGFSRPLIRAEAARRIVLPADKVDVFQENLAKHDASSLVSWQVYHPKRGEKLGTIAKKFHFSVAELKRVNGIPSRSWRVPRVLVVPMNGEAKAGVAKLPLMYAAPVPAVRQVHVVRRGDTLSSIAARNRVSVSALKQWNRVGRYLQIGQRIYIR
jgi:membrane-bound lytic murein transglycosylase D